MPFSSIPKCFGLSLSYPFTFPCCCFSAASSRFHSYIIFILGNFYSADVYSWQRFWEGDKKPSAELASRAARAPSHSQSQKTEVLHPSLCVDAQPFAGSRHVQTVTYSVLEAPSSLSNAHSALTVVVSVCTGENLFLFFPFYRCLSLNAAPRLSAAFSVMSWHACRKRGCVPFPNTLLVAYVCMCASVCERVKWLEGGKDGGRD